MKTALEQKIIDRANEQANLGMAMGNGFDPDCPMTTLSEALAYFVLEEMGEESGEEIYDLITSKFKDDE